VGKNFLPLWDDVLDSLLKHRLNGLGLIIREHLKRAGKENGNLLLTKQDFMKRAGIAHDSVAGTIRRLEAKGLIKTRGGDFNPGTGHRNHLRFTLTFRVSTKGTENPSFLARPKTRTPQAENRD
jgi:hypothetical protein